MDRIDHWVNKLWKDGGSIHMELDEKLRFLYEHGKEEQIGMYLRDVNLCIVIPILTKLTEKEVIVREHTNISRI